MMAAPRLSLFGLLLALALPASAGIYTYIDAEGNRVFTDRPGGQAVETVDPRSINSMPAQPVAQPAAAREVLREPAPAYQLLDIVQPEPDATVRNNAGELIVSVTSDPALLFGHQYRLLLDGGPITPNSSDSTFALNNIDRGSHQLIVEVIDADGKVLQGSAPSTFHMMRTSLAQRRMVNPCKKNDYGVRPECPLKDKPKEKKDIPFVPFL